jgi:hypothetical protein
MIRRYCGTDFTHKSCLVRDHFQSVKSVVKLLWLRLAAPGIMQTLFGIRVERIQLFSSKKVSPPVSYRVMLATPGPGQTCRAMRSGKQKIAKMMMKTQSLCGSPIMKPITLILPSHQLTHFPGTGQRSGHHCRRQACLDQRHRRTNRPSSYQSGHSCRRAVNGI